ARHDTRDRPPGQRLRGLSEPRGSCRLPGRGGRARAGLRHGSQRRKSPTDPPAGRAISSTRVRRPESVAVHGPPRGRDRRCARRLRRGRRARDRRVARRARRRDARL
ncbi:MAG: hypothetical protein AVDCRST_MAG67-659, partial [uncultured Solirubrobacteraceae bacterium]